MHSSKWTIFSMKITHEQFAVTTGKFGVTNVWKFLSETLR